MEAEIHNSCGTPDCCRQCDTATIMEVIENNDGTKNVTFIPLNKEHLPKS